MPHYIILSVSFYSLYRLCTTEPWLKFCWDQKSTKSNVHKYIPNFVKVALAKSFLKDPDTYIKRLYSPKKTVVKNRNNIIHRNPSPKRYPPPNPHSHSESKNFFNLYNVIGTCTITLHPFKTCAELSKAHRTYYVTFIALFFPFSEHSDSHEGYFNGRPPRKTAQLTPPVSKNSQNVHQNTFNVSFFLKRKCLIWDCLKIHAARHDGMAKSEIVKSAG